MADADLAGDGLESLSTNNRRTMTFDEMRSFNRTPGDLFAEFRDSFEGTVHYEYARLEDYREATIKHHRLMGIDESFTTDEEVMNYLVGFAMISRAFAFRHEDFIQLLDHNLSQIFDMGAAQLWCINNVEYLDPLAQPALQGTTPAATQAA